MNHPKFMPLAFIVTGIIMALFTSSIFLPTICFVFAWWTSPDED